MDLADSGDESGDLSVIMEVRRKTDPYTTGVEDSDEDCAELAAISDELRDYATSTMDILNGAMNEEAADEIRLSPEYPGEDPYPVVEEPQNPKEPVPDPDMGGPVAASSPTHAPADQPGVPPPAAPTEEKTFTDMQGVMTIKDVEQKILYLKCLGFKWGKLQRFNFVSVLEFKGLVAGVGRRKFSLSCLLGCIPTSLLFEATPCHEETEGAACFRFCGHSPL